MVQLQNTLLQKKLLQLSGKEYVENLILIYQILGGFSRHHSGKQLFVHYRVKVESIIHNAKRSLSTDRWGEGAVLSAPEYSYGWGGRINGGGSCDYSTALTLPCILWMGEGSTVLLEVLQVYCASCKLWTVWGGVILGGGVGLLGEKTRHNYFIKLLLNVYRAKMLWWQSLLPAGYALVDRLWAEHDRLWAEHALLETGSQAGKADRCPRKDHPTDKENIVASLFACV